MPFAWCSSGREGGVWVSTRREDIADRGASNVKGRVQTGGGHGGALKKTKESDVRDAKRAPWGGGGRNTEGVCVRGEAQIAYRSSRVGRVRERALWCACCL